MNNSLFSQLIGLLMELICPLIVVASFVVVGWCSFVCADSLFITDQDGIATIVSTSHRRAKTSILPYNINQQGGFLQIHHRGEKWYITVKMNDITETFSVVEGSYGKAVIGKQIPVRYGKGRFTGTTYITTANFD